ncbi:putative pheromone receptor [Mycena vitilis]|nr:putative pheromone receptor [Mycena vitilis]
MSYFYTGTPNWLFSLFAFVGFLCSAIPLPWHLEAWNTGTCLYMIWTALACLVFFIDSVVWSGNTIDWSPTCDALPQRLQSRDPRVRKSKSEKRKAIVIDLAIGLGLPLLQIPLQYIVQGHRYNIFEDIGCLGETFETPVAVVLFHLPPILVGCVSAVYCILSIRSFYRSRVQLKELLSSNNNLNLNRYVRLMCLASTDLLFTIPLSIWVLWVNVSVVGLSPWISWADTHSNFSRVLQVPGVFWRADVYTVASLETTRWATTACALLFFGYFGFADEAIKNYRTYFFTVAKRVGYTHASFGSGVTSSSGATSKQMASSRHGASATLPVFIRKETAQKRDSFDSFSDLDSSVSKSYGALDYVDADKEKGLVRGASFGQLSVGDVDSRPATPSHAAHEARQEEIEVSSLHHASVCGGSLASPEAARTHTKHAPDIPMRVGARDVDDTRIL